MRVTLLGAEAADDISGEKQEAHAATFSLARIHHS
jgi:hypothetical protein